MPDARESWTRRVYHPRKQGSEHVCRPLGRKFSKIWTGWEKRLPLNNKNVNCCWAKWMVDTPCHRLLIHWYPINPCLDLGLVCLVSCNPTCQGVWGAQASWNLAWYRKCSVIGHALKKGRLKKCPYAHTHPYPNQRIPHTPFLTTTMHIYLSSSLVLKVSLPQRRLDKLPPLQERDPPVRHGLRRMLGGHHAVWSTAGPAHLLSGWDQSRKRVRPL